MGAVKLFRRGVVPSTFAPIELMGAQLGTEPPPIKGYTGTRVLLIPQQIGTGPNWGFNRAAAEGDVEPELIQGVEIFYLASFGENFFNLRMGPNPGELQINGADHVLLNSPGISIFKTDRFDWSGVNLRYQGNKENIAALFSALPAKGTLIDVYVPD